MTKMPCEIVVWYLLPVIRKELAGRLKEKGLTQNEIAKRMGVTPAAVSQYLNSKRGISGLNGIPCSKAMDALAEKVFLGETGISEGICGVCGICKDKIDLERVWAASKQSNKADAAKSGR